MALERGFPVLTGRCHCGAVQVEFRPLSPASAIPVRACQCGFCRRHGAATATDPLGQVLIRGDRPLVRYRFGARTIDMLICGVCGIYVAAVQEADGDLRATVNVAGLSMAPLDRATPVPVRYDGEDARARRARRASGWTPTTVLEGRG